MMKIGTLLPGSTFHLLLQHDFQAAMAAYFQYRQTNTALISSNIKYGTDANVVHQEAEKMLLEEKVDILVLYADQATLKQTADLARALNKLIILVHGGAKYMHSWEPHPAVLSHTLNSTIHCRLTGMHAATQAAQAAFCTSFYDGGYSHCHAISDAYTNNGGELTYNYVSPLKTDASDTAPLQAFLNDNPATRALLSLFNSDPAYHFLQQLQRSGINDLQLYGSPMLLDETLPMMHGPLELPFRLRGYVPWVSVLDSPANECFKTQFRQHSGREAGLAALHGWDTGIILEQILKTADQHRFRAAEILEMMKEVQLESPRGALHMDAATHHMLGPSWLVQMNSAFQPEILGGVDNTTHTWQEIVNTKLEGPSSGWINTYLCA
ncbi:ABC transporter substrate-binding protein [Chitinophaga sp. G-6-1-13]|uniref:ABC transporter substrate-binding protein n=1 Tax=Chitinophaga fulva TaxID=2728842 RepID=A0A848GNE5_9BACT|nr:ABC transporter substrate-binding protein [Chitinophaga fulva]NML39934.1 ABC transporter substrate-binding protein [Chitinophaga fulva]